MNRYDNYLEQLDENPVGTLPKLTHRTRDYFNYHYFTLYCCLTKKNSDARKRLANKISYISLYDYMHMLDNHHKVIKELQQTVQEKNKENRKLQSKMDELAET